VTIVTLMFAPVFAHHHWMWRLVGKTQESHIEQCVAKQPCPKKKRIVNIVTVAQAPTPPPKGKGSDNNNDANDANVVDDPHAFVVADDGSDQSEPIAPKQH
jgi:hypothetical protein